MIFDAPYGWEPVPLKRRGRRIRYAARGRDFPMLALSVRLGLHAKAYENEEQRRTLDESAGYWVVQPGDVVLNPMWIFKGAVATSQLAEAGIVSPAYVVLRPTTDHDARFIAYQLKSAPMAQWYAAEARGETTYDRAVKWDALSALGIPAPGLHRQAAIADFLDRECERIEKVQTTALRVSEATDALTRAAMYKHLAGVELSDALERGIWPAGWPRLKHLVNTWYAGATPDSNETRYWTEPPHGRPWVAIGDMSNRDQVVETSRALTREGADAVRIKTAPAGTLLFAMYASVGEVAEIAMPASFNQALLGLWIPDPLLRAFVFHWLRYVRPYLALFTKSSTQANLTADLVRNIPICPFRDDERRVAVTSIGAVADARRRADATADSLVRRLAEYRDALITEAVTGQLDVAKASEAQMAERLHAASEGRLEEVA